MVQVAELRPVLARRIGLARLPHSDTTPACEGTVKYLGLWILGKWNKIR